MNNSGFDFYTARYSSTQDGRDTMNVLQSGLSIIAEEHRAECKLCSFVATGDSYGEILQKLGEHGERAHGL
jgi:hypothetical protein